MKFKSILFVAFLAVASVSFGWGGRFYRCYPQVAFPSPCGQCRTVAACAPCETVAIPCGPVSTCDSCALAPNGGGFSQWDGSPNCPSGSDCEYVPTTEGIEAISEEVDRCEACEPVQACAPVATCEPIRKPEIVADGYVCEGGSCYVCKNGTCRRPVANCVGGACKLAKGAVKVAATPIELLARVNAIRTSRGLCALELDQTLETGVESHCYAMARYGRVYHASGCGFEIAAQNSGYGIDGALNQWLNSPGHAQILLNPNLKVAGVFAYRDATGRNWCAIRFR